ADGETQSALLQAATELKSLAENLVEPSLEDRVLNAYPMPIALAYRRFRDSRFNVYEQVLRLRDLFEATSFLVYNVVLADSLRRLSPEKYFIADAGARRSYNNFSMAMRLGFVDAIINIANQAKSQNDLFMPELSGINFVKIAKQLQAEFRNRISHTATATEGQQRNL